MAIYIYMLLLFDIKLKKTEIIVYEVLFDTYS